MKKFAVAFIFQSIPAFDSITVTNGIVRYFKGPDLVMSIGKDLNPVVPLEIEIWFIDATDEVDASKKVLTSFPHHILQIIAREINA